MTSFDNDARAQLIAELQNEIEVARRWSRHNQGWDVGFRVGLLLLGLAIVVCSGIATSELFENPKPWSLVSTILAGVSAVISGFAFTDFSFAKRQRLWEKKANSLRSLRDELRFANPEVDAFRKRLDEVRSWGDHTDPDAD